MVEALGRLRTALAGSYTVERELGHGGMSVVFLARDLRHDRNVAIKVLRPELAPSLGADRFLREIQIEASLQHPHILPLYDSGEADGLLYYVMPYVEGESLRDRLGREEQLQVDDVLRITREVAEALAYAHGHGVVHRDIKPENILLTGDHAVVADFGIARALVEAGGERLTASGIAIGTPSYMSPEQGSADGKVDARSDIYSLGCVVYEMLVGEPPFTGRTAQAVIARQMQERVPSLEVVRPNLPHAIVEVVEKALAKVPADRYQTATAFGEALARGARGEVRVVRRRASPWRWVALAAAAVVAAAVVALWPSPPLDPNRLVVFPFELSGDVQPDEATIGDETESVIWNELDGRVPLKWLRGSFLTDEPDRLATMPSRRRRELARRNGAGFYVHGQVRLVGDSAQAHVQLYDVTGDSIVARADTAGLRYDGRSLGTWALGELLLSLLPDVKHIDVSAVAGRDAQVIQTFVQAERDFHAGRYGEALGNYSDAVDQDSGFALAAVKAAQAASWNHKADEAGELIGVALEHVDLLPVRWTHFARGFEAFLDDRADTAVYEFERAIELDPEWPDGWMGLGEVYTHLLPRKSPQDSIAKDAFSKVYERSSGFAPAMYHLIEYVMRDGDLRRASDLLAEYRAADPDRPELGNLELALDCVEGSPEAIDWRAATRSDPEQVLQAARSLHVGAAFLDCAEAGWRAVLDHDAGGGVDATSREFSALIGLQSLLVATGRFDELVNLLDSAAAADYARQVDVFYVLDAVAGGDVQDEATVSAARLRTQAWDSEEIRLWTLGVWDAQRDNLAAARASRDTLAMLATEDGRCMTNQMAGSLGGHLAVAEGDAQGAIEVFESLSVSCVRPTWYPWQGLGLEWMALARLYYAQGRFADALRVAKSFDAPGSVPNLVYLPESLQLRMRAARELGDAVLARRYRERLIDLGRRDLVDSEAAWQR